MIRRSIRIQSRRPGGDSRALEKEGSEISNRKISKTNDKPKEIQGSVPKASETNNSIDDDELSKIADDVLKELYTRPNPKWKYAYNHWFVNIPNEIHQLDILYLSHDSSVRLKQGDNGQVDPSDKNIYKYVLTLCDVASRYCQAKELTSYSAKNTLDALMSIYNTDKNLKIPKKINVDMGSNFTSDLFKKWCAENNIELLINLKGSHLSFVENVNKLIATDLYKIQAKNELLTNKTDRRWVGNLNSVIEKLNKRPMKSLDKLSPIEAVKLDNVKLTLTKSRVSEKDRNLKYPIGTIVRRMLKPDEYLDLASNSISIERRRATDPFWSLDLYRVTENYRPCRECVTYHKLVDMNTGKPYGKSLPYFQLFKTKFYNTKT